VATAVPTVTIEPATGLVDFQLVEVTATGFAPFELVEIFECAGDAVDISGCDPENAYLVDSDATGRVQVPIPVDARIYDETDREYDCRIEPAGCMIGVGLLLDFESSGFAPIMFDPDAPLRPVPTIALSRSNKLRTNQVVRVRATNMSPLFETFVYQCIANREWGGRSCSFAQDVRAVPDAHGVVWVDYRVERLLRPSLGGPAFDCASAPGACVLQASLGFTGTPDRVAARPLTFLGH
jgi:hypothetical protein